jgi:RNA polymerase sigma-70 factor (ECF subfamily)
MVRLGEGDREAFAPLYEALWPLSLRLSQRLLPAAEAEDAAQAALLKVFARAAEFDPERDAVAWVVGITAFECRTARQKRVRRREDTTAAVGDVHDGRDEEARLVQRDLLAAAEDVLGSLRPEDAETLSQVLAGQPPSIPRATFRKRVERAMKRFRAAWSERYEE